MIGSMADELVQDMLALATHLAKEAAAIALPRLGHTSVTWKADSSPVTDVDHAVQAHIVNAIAEAYPDHAVCAEETLREPHAHPNRANARYCWVIDPLDGTRNYASGLPCFATSIAVLDRSRPVVAVVLEHNVHYLYTAVLGGGATLDGQPIHVKEGPAGADILVGTPSSKDKLAVAVVCNWAATPGLICRNLGSTALHLAMVASGALNGVFGRRSKIWDIAAGVLLVTEAGGRITDPFGADRLPFDLEADPNDDLPFLAAAPKVHERLLSSIQAVAP
ncbi:MAG: inositol monophosphatase [Phycisphaerae bacterium]